MFCFFIQWVISLRLESGTELPKLVKRHISNCGKCEEFLEFSHSLGHHLKKDVKMLLLESPENLPYRINTSLNASTQKRPKTKPQIRLRPIPFFAATIALIVAFVIVYFQVLTVSPLPPENTIMSINLLKTASGEHISIPAIAKEIETPIETEMKQLKQALVIAKNHLISTLDLNLN